MFTSNYLNYIICAGMGEKIGCQRAFFRAAAVVFFPYLSWWQGNVRELARPGHVVNDGVSPV
jgi:hypothetical protein